MFSQLTHLTSLFFNKQRDLRNFLWYFILLHLPPLRFHCVGGCWDRTQDCCDFGIGSQAL
jgi:hypothetical protein